MTKFKVVAIPQVELSGVKGSELYSLKTANLALAPVADAIQKEAMGG